jgi:FAD/FMN-containing dehydrogenase
MSILAELRAIVGDGHVVGDPDVRASYEHDITGRFAGSALAVVRPGSVDEVAAVVGACARLNQRLVVRGGGTGLVGGAVPLAADELVLSLERLTDVADSSDGGDLIAQAGATLEQLHRAATARGAMFALDFAARGAATVGGMLATNAAGALALRYGPMRAQLAGIEVVLASGERVERMSGLKDTAGYDWPRLLVGSEGTLGVITRARLKLRPPPGPRAVALVGLDAIEDGVRLVRDLQRPAAGAVEAIDVFDARSMELVCMRRRLTPPVAAHPWYVVVQVAADDPTGVLAQALGDRDVAVAEDTARREALWEYRDAINEAIGAAGVPHKFDVSVALAQIASLLSAVRGELSSGAELITFGHLGDGNLHLNVLGLEPEGGRIDALILERVAAHGGSISAEHGIGVAKREFLHLTRSSQDIRVMRALKAALDPDDLLGRGRVLP